MKKTILIVGGAGFIGSQINLMLDEAGYHTIVLDNLSIGGVEAVVCGKFIEGDMNDSALLDKIFTNYKIDAVIHTAALIEIGESIRKPAEYYYNNVANTLNLLLAMLRHKIEFFIFSSTAGVYGIPENIPIIENTPYSPIHPYGESKLMVEKILRDFNYAYGLKYCCLRYFNAAGGDPSGRIKNCKKKEANLIPIALRTLLEKKPLTLFGTDYPTRDGTCIRDYVHIWDIGAAHIIAMEKLFTGSSSLIYNLGNGEGFSNKEVLEVVEKITGQKLDLHYGPRREGDPPILVASAAKAEIELGWRPKYPTLDEMVEHAWLALKK